MYLSVLKVNAEGNPNLPRHGRDWLKNPYEVHQRLCLAFPAFKRDDKGNRIAREDDDANFLYRIEGLPARVIVLSRSQPNWQNAFGNALYLLKEWPENAVLFIPSFSINQKLRFRLLANPTFRAKDERFLGKRCSLNTDGERFQWLEKKGVSLETNGHKRGGFSVFADNTTIDARGSIVSWRRKDGETKDDKRKMIFDAVLFEGTLTVTDPVAFANTVASGIGSGKAFGFGLLSLAR